MTTLKCSAATCLYNKEHLCARGNINVTGEDAHHSAETSCGSFLEQSGSSAKNIKDCECGCKEIQIDCKACNCTYNENCKCTASAIQVTGSQAHDSAETTCGTFECKA